MNLIVLGRMGSDVFRLSFLFSVFTTLDGIDLMRMEFRFLFNIFNVLLSQYYLASFCDCVHFLCAEYMIGTMIVGMKQDRSSELELDDATAADQEEDRAGGDYSSSGVTRASSPESSDCVATSDDDEDDNDDEDIPMAVPIEGAGDARVNDGNPPELDDADGRWIDLGAGVPQPPPPPPSSSSTTSGALHPHGNGGMERRGRGSHSNSRSAAAAHRNRQVHVPPIVSPGLLMLPAPANASEGGRQRRLVIVLNDRTGENEEYILPSTVFRESMVAGGYTIGLRRGTHGPPSRGSSTERTVGDVFDCDAGPGMFLHFPDLLAAALWDRRVGDKEGGGEGTRQVRGEDDDGGPGGRPRGGGEGGGLGDGAPVVCPRDADAPSSIPQKAGPKGARSSYIFFTNAQRPIMMMQFPGMKFTEQGVIMGERWRALTPEEKRPYEEMAAADKERHAKEMREYVEGVRQEMEAGKTHTEDVSLMEWAQVKVQKSMMEQEGSKDASEDSAAEEMGGGDVLMTMGEGGEVRGPRLVDAVILSLSKMLGEESSRRETRPEGSVLSPEIQTEGVTSRHVSPDLTLAELPSFTPPSTYPQTRPHPRPHVPMSFLDMIPVSLTARYPTSYVAKRLVYAQAVQAREEAIFAAQEAKDDADDEEEKYQAHVEAWERMVEYQKGQIAKREVEWRRERKLSDAAEKGAGEGEGSSDDGRNVAAEGSNDGVEDGADETPNACGSASGNDGCMETKVRPNTPPPEDPMECMPPRPQRPGPPRDIFIPDIPTPPSPPPTVMGDGENDRQLEMKGIDCDASVVQMLVPKVDQILLRHLDQSCFLPTMLGRYFGLLSNHISDPQFCGILAPGIAGNTVGGGTGLATSYPGGGRGAVPVRGGGSWHYSAAAGSKSSVEQSEKKVKILVPDEVTSSEVAASPSAPAVAGALSDLATVHGDSSLPTPAYAKEKRLMSDGSTSHPSDNKNKKQKRATTFLLTTGDRNTSATEISSGSAGSEFPDGWLVKTYRRSGGETIGKTDRFWFSPGRNIRFRAKKHARAFVAILIEPEIDGDEDKAAEIYKTRGLHF